MMTYSTPELNRLADLLKSKWGEVIRLMIMRGMQYNWSNPEFQNNVFKEFVKYAKKKGYRP